MSKAGKLDAEKIKHIAMLARLGLSDSEAEAYVEQMNAVLGYMDILKEISTDKVEMTLQVNGLRNAMRADDVLPQVAPEELLAVSPLPKINGQIAVRAVIKEE